MNMKKTQAFALLDVILAVILLAIATAGSYALIKSFRSSSQVQQLTRYATNISQNYMPFLQGGTYSSVLSGDKLSSEFLLSIGIPADDVVNCDSGYCYVNTGVYANGKESVLNFKEVIDDSVTHANYFVQGLIATGAETNAITQGLSTAFSVFCVVSNGPLAADTQSCSLLSDDEKSGSYAVYLVFPKSGHLPPTDAAGFQAAYQS